MRKGRPWSPEEDELLLCRQFSFEEVAAKTSRTPAACERRFYSLMNGIGYAKVWTDVQKQQFKDLLRDGHTMKECASILERSYPSVKWMAKQLGIKAQVRLRRIRGRLMRVPAWTRRDKAQLAELAGTMPMSEAAKVLNRSTLALRQQARLQGIKWYAGTTDASFLARELEVADYTIIRLINILFYDKKHKPVTRHQLSDEEADRIRKCVNSNKKYHPRKYKANRTNYGSSSS